MGVTVKAIIFLSAINLLVRQTFQVGDFCYDKESCNERSTHWSGICHTGKHQSPINLNDDNEQLNERRNSSKVGGGTSPIFLNTENPPKSKLATIHFNDQYKGPHFFIQNNGHTIAILLDANLTSKARMIGYGLPEPYIFVQAHFHWSPNSYAGSEHTVNGQKYSMELHLVHYSSRYRSFEEATGASNDPRALAVVAIFLETIPYYEPQHKVLSAIVNHIPLGFQPKPQLVNEPLDLTPLLPTKGQVFYRYLGSLTTPGCAETVVWTVFKDPILISNSIFQVFQNVSDSGGQPLGTNDRSVQKVGDRDVERLILK